MKLKRLLTAALSAVMALSVCALPAMADDTTTAATPNPVWLQDHGSITIHKYEWNGDSNKHATGEADNKQLPGDTSTTPSPLKDAEFTLYEVKDAAWLKAYYSGKPDDMIQASVFDWNTYAEKDTPSGDYKLRDGVSVPLVGKKNTDANGVATFDKGASGQNLPLGLYLVMETKSPDQVTTPCEPFLVSVPMTRVGATNPQSDWLYDVHVYPKNRTSYGDITLTKMGQVGKDAATAALSGVTFKLYKFVGTKDANGKINAFTTTNFADATDTAVTGKVWKQITKASTAAGDNTGSDFGLTTGSNGKITVNDLSAGYYCFVEQSVGENKAFITDQTPHYFEVKGETSQEVTVAADGTVTPKADSTEANNLEMTVTDPRPDVEKQVKDRTPAVGGEEYVKASDYSVGDDVPYKVTVKVPQALLNAKIKDADTDKFVFEVKDTPENLAVNKDVKVNSTAVSAGVTITYDDANSKGGKGFTAKFTQAALKTLVGSGDTFTIEYTAKLLKEAYMTTAGNHNAVSLKYSNKIDADGNIVPGNSSEIEDGSVVYTFGIHVDKRGDTATGTPLSGVKFNVYKEVAEGTVNAVKGSAIGITDADKDKSFAKVVINDTETGEAKYDLVTVSGAAKVDGLANGTYYLVETATVNDYNLLSAPVKVEIKVEYAKTWTVVDTYDGDKLTHHRESTNVEYFGGTNAKPNNGFATTTIINRKGFNLPVTGGFGTLLFSGIGVLLVLAGVSVLFSLKKKNKRA
jgi:Cna protein B-type domain protein